MTTIMNIDFDANLMQSLLWQFNEASRLQTIIQQEQDWYNINQSKFWTDWVRDVFDLRTANDFGLTVWSIILNIPIIVQNEEPVSPDIPFGFDVSDGNFEHSNFAYDPNSAQTLTTEQARLVLFMRYHQLTSDGTVPYTNEFLSKIFADMDGAYAVDNHDMTITYVFRKQPPARLWFVLRNYDILPRPAGVRVRDILVIPKIPFGFDEHNENFDNSNFLF